MCDIFKVYRRSSVEKRKETADRLGQLVERRTAVRQVAPRAQDTAEAHMYDIIQHAGATFDYCAAVWDSSGIGCKGYLDKLNRRAVCIIKGRSIGADKLHTVFSWPNLQARRDYLKCDLVYKSLHNLAPAYLLTEFKYAHQIHSYNTRHHELLRLLLVKTAKYQGSFRLNGARAFNALPPKIRNAVDLKEFKILAKHHLKRSMLIP